jgi:hypothetical protein
MRFDSVINLVEMNVATDDDGFPESTISGRKTVFAQKGSIKSHEFYSASQSGFSLELMFELLTLEYEAQKFVEYETKVYEVIRTYEKGKFTELICQAYVESPSVRK